ncbi:TRAP transporter substrate-binding protein [Biomaibacter acetigenes]|jgi:tripartite ATP-independent transporter DctP family solute receptor|uniref:TRAP transporter substrate-binding protein n=1 Tax=Biomaibacter acetigenes TaxID=2316383 RepID=A0A3G2R2X4_9FIRM|nr:TRAP transporter substrate-binding protein [Biomaibacter acetigenes]AYO29665.1 TRAP transporter substrate-binding protein [Biomaibacter acetigenes]
MKKLLTSIIIIFVISMLILTGCGGTGQSSAPQSGNNQSQESNQGSGSAVVLKLSHTGNPQHFYQKGAEKFAELVNQKTNGQVKIEIYPSDSLAPQRESVEGAQLGTIDMVLTSTMELSNFEQSIGVFDLPFLFSSREKAYAVFDGPIGQKVSKTFENKGLVILAYWENGFRHITNNKKPINTPEDLKGMKIRVPESSVFIDTFKALGASPTPISFGELYSALQLGTVDGQENPLAHLINQKFYEVQKYCTLTGHFYTAEPLVISKMVWDKLTPDQQKAIKDAAIEAGKFERELSKEADDKYLQEAKDKGVQFVEKPDLATFQKAVQPVYDKYQSKFGDLLKEVKAAAK